MNQNSHSIPSLPDLSGWDRLPVRHESLPGQMTMFDGDNEECLGDQELFETGRDLPGASERSQRIIWDVQ